MRKMLIVGMVLLLGVAAAGLAGCGGNTGQAKTDMQTADAAYAKVKTELDNMGNSLTSVLGGAISGNYSQLTPQVLAQATAEIDKVLADMPAVKAEYQKLASLTGVPDYTSYANAMIKALDANTAAVQGGKQLITALTPFVAAGNTAGIQQYFTANAATLNDLQTLSNNATKAYEDAQTIKTEKNLGK